MSNATKCDRCGACYEYGGMTVGEEYDLCDGCVADFEAWIEHQPVTGAPERVTNQAEMSHDTREQLEADVREYANPTDAKGTLGASWERKMLGFLDRQAAITERETLHSHPMCAGSDACPALNRPNGESADRETPDTAENDATKGEIRNFDDSREQLEADVRQILHSAYMLAWMHGHENRRGSSFEKLHVEFYNLLDRQAAITEREVKLRELHKFEENHRWHVRSIEEVNQQLNKRIAELKAEIATLKEHRAGNMERLRELTDANTEMAWRIQQLEKEVSR